MTDWKSSAVVTADYFVLLKLYHAMWGVLLWEFVVNIGFEYSVFTGKRKFRLSFLTGMRDGSTQASTYSFIWVSGGSLCSSSSLYSWDSTQSTGSTASTLSAAIWGLNKIAISIAAAAWLVDAGTIIRITIIIRGAWNESLGGASCRVTNGAEARTNVLVSFVAELVLLALMLTGLLRWENARQKGGIWWLLYTQADHSRRQGLAWMIIVAAAEAPIVVFILLNLNVVTMTIGASRVYRGLSDYVHKESNVHMSRGFPVRQSTIGTFVPRAGRGSLAVGTSGTLDGHLFEMDILAPPRHEEKWTNGLENRVAFVGIGKALDLK
ncbi:hypothetical protein H4582DRAFT_2058952 [Lactarius indigo]|nr:hypothetical protein H4582DRAFT_2058952 [Lactarius indigo]